MTADAGALCLKSGNAAILRGGSELDAFQPRHSRLRSNRACATPGLPEAAIQLIPTRDRAAVGHMLAGLDGNHRRHRAARRQEPGRARAERGARAGVRASRRRRAYLHRQSRRSRHGEDHRAQRQDAPHRRLRRGRNAAGRSRRGRERISSRWSRCCIDAGCEMRGDKATQAIDARVKAATEDDWRTEYLDAIIAVGVVDGVDAAIAHIESYGSHHTDAIITDDDADRREIPRAGRFRHRAAQCVDAIRRRRRVRLRRRDRHRHRPSACARAGRRRAAHDVQIPHSRERSDKTVIAPQIARQKLADNERILPPHAPGMRIGLFGGTFDPPHQAHLDASLLAMKRLKLDRVWWLVTPGNPLKNTSHLAPLNERLAAARALTHHPRIDVTGLEAVISTRYHLRHDLVAAQALPARALRLDHGRRQSAPLPPLAEMARHRRAVADGGGRSASAPAFTPRPRPPDRLWRAFAFPRMPRHRCPAAARRPGPFCTG